jgi:hypothetical protein
LLAEFSGPRGVAPVADLMSEATVGPQEDVRTDSLMTAAGISGWRDLAPKIGKGNRFSSLDNVARQDLADFHTDFLYPPPDNRQGVKRAVAAISRRLTDGSA